MNIAIMGATSHIARNLIVRFAAESPDDRLLLFCRKRQPVEEFTGRYAPHGNIQIVEGYGDFDRYPMDVMINCVGAGTPGSTGFDVRNWFSVTAKFDDLALDYLAKTNPGALLINFSSGGIYGTRTSPPFGEMSELRIPVNNIAVSDYYSIARLHSEAKHHSHPEWRIVDLRIFSFFSSFMPPDAGYFMSDVLKAVADNETLITRQDDMIRDYIAPDDLFRLIKFCISRQEINGAFDVTSAKPAGKFEILECFQEKFGLKWRFDRVKDSPNGSKPVYFSESERLQKAGFRAEYTSLDGLIVEVERFLANRKKELDN